MNKFFRCFVILLMTVNFCLFAADSSFEVKVAIDAPRYTRTVADDLANKAKSEALKKYLLRLDANMGQDLIRKACTEIDTFVDDIEQENVKWTDITKNAGQLAGSYVVELKLEDINQWLKVNGFKTQGKIALVILEEPPSLGAMKLTSEAGTESGGDKAFIQNYTSFQRRVRDCIIKKVDEFGFDVNLLADHELYEEYKNKDNELVGVFFDPETNNFAINKELLSAVRSNNPDTLVLYYRLETVEFEKATNQVRTTVALNIKNLNSNVTKSFGSETFALISKATTTSMLVDDLGFSAEKAILKLMNAEGASSRLNKLVMEIKNTANAPAGPIKVTINGEVFDAKIRKKVLYQLKKQLVEAGVSTADKMKSNNTTLTFEALPEFKDVEKLYFEKISPIFDELGAEIEDDKIFYGKSTITIKP